MGRREQLPEAARLGRTQAPRVLTQAPSAAEGLLCVLCSWGTASLSAFSKVPEQRESLAGEQCGALLKGPPWG